MSEVETEVAKHKAAYSRCHKTGRPLSEPRVCRDCNTMFFFEADMYGEHQNYCYKFAAENCLLIRSKGKHLEYGQGQHEPLWLQKHLRSVRIRSGAEKQSVAVGSESSGSTSVWCSRARLNYVQFVLVLGTRLRNRRRHCHRHCIRNRHRNRHHHRHAVVFALFLCLCLCLCRRLCIYICLCI